MPAPLLRQKKNVHKNTFGHVLVLAGSRHMMGAAALTSLAALRAGAGLVTLGVPKSLNGVAQKKISPTIMTLSLNETKDQALSIAALSQIQKRFLSFAVLAIGPGLSQHQSTQKLIRKIVAVSPIPLVIDADACNALSKNPEILLKNKAQKIITPHPGEMSRLTGLRKSDIEKDRTKVAKDFAKKYRCIVLLKGNRTVVADQRGRLYINRTGNPGMATAGCGDVLTGIIAAFLAQGLSAFNAAKFAAYIHGRAGDLAAKKRSMTSMIATDILEKVSGAIRKSV
ncbi:MAG: NAD(P)H-hydrate dehydratase [Candidatus Omnitrophota bacterium]